MTYMKYNLCNKIYKYNEREECGAKSNSVAKRTTFTLENLSYPFLKIDNYKI